MEINNRKAKYDYEILSTIECGIVLTGTEIKSIREGKVNIKDSYAIIRNDEIYLLNTHISIYEEGNRFNHEEDRTRKMTEEKVPAETYFLVRKRDNKIVGMINIRLQLNEKLKAFGGNIGYSIRPTERRKGYNKINLYLALQICQKHKIKEVMLDCDKDNLGSAKTMQALGGKLTKEYYDENVKCLVQQYIIDVDKSVEKYKNILYKSIEKNI